MSSKIDNSAKTGNILMLSSLVVSLVLPLALILFSYTEIISGTAAYVAALGVIASSIYIIGGGIWMFTQDRADGKALTNG
jgi:hypothetical protein